MNAKGKNTKVSRIKGAAAVAAISVALIGAPAAAASAAGYEDPLRGGESRDFWTNVIGPTTICLTNTGPQYGSVTFSAPGSAPENDLIRPFGRYCKEAWWWGYDVNLTNHGSYDLIVKRQNWLPW